MSGPLAQLSRAFKTSAFFGKKSGMCMCEWCVTGGFNSSAPAVLPASVTCNVSLTPLPLLLTGIYRFLLTYASYEYDMLLLADSSSH